MASSTPATTDTKSEVTELKSQIIALQAVRSSPAFNYDFTDKFKKIAFLHASGGMKPEIYQTMQQLVAVFENKPMSLKGAVSVSRVARDMPAGKNPGEYKAFANYVGSTLRDLVIRTDDLIIVYESMEDSTVFVGYNTRTGLGGQFPSKIVYRMQEVPDIYQKLVVCTLPRSFMNARADDLSYDARDYVRLCKVENNGKKGYGMNQRTLKWGHVQMDCTKNIDL